MCSLSALIVVVVVVVLYPLATVVIKTSLVCYMLYTKTFCYLCEGRLELASKAPVSTDWLGLTNCEVSFCPQT